MGDKLCYLCCYAENNKKYLLNINKNLSLRSKKTTQHK